MKPHLFNKIVKASIGELPKNVRSCPNTSSFDFISGTGGKGNFEIYSFFDNTGNLVNRSRLYKQGNKTTKEVSYYKNYNPNYVNIGDAKVIKTTTYK